MITKRQNLTDKIFRVSVIPMLEVTNVINIHRRRKIKSNNATLA